MQRLSFLAVLLNIIPGMGLIYVGGDHILPDGTIRNRIKQGINIFLLFCLTGGICLFIQWLLYKTLDKTLPASYQTLLLFVIWWIFFISTVERCYWAAVMVNVQKKLATIAIDSHPAIEKDLRKAAKLNLIPGVGRLYVGGWLNVILFLVDLALYPVAVLVFLLARPIILDGFQRLGLVIPSWLLAIIFFFALVVVSEGILYHEGERTAENHNEAYLGL
jgi:hypothetical protein